ncbi:hypothetical protein GF366_00470 [Candidatus Peregrinibacteria bacterium]|nr:hypothetical protein [Candidatus Peregrinibacteria bacterium]
MDSKINGGKLELPDSELLDINNTADPDSETLGEEGDIIENTSSRASGIISADDRKGSPDGFFTSVPQPEVTPRFVSRIAEKMMRTIQSLLEKNDIPMQKRRSIKEIMENLREIEQINEPAYPKANPKVLNPGLEPIKLLAIQAIQVIKNLNRGRKNPIYVDDYFKRTFDEWLGGIIEELEKEDRDTKVVYLAQQLIFGDINPEELSDEILSAILEEIEREEGEDVSDFLELFQKTDHELNEVSNHDMIPRAAVVLEIRENTRPKRVFSE